MARRSRRAAFTQEQKDIAETEIEQLELSVKFLVTDYTVDYLVGKLRADEYYVPPYQRAFVWKVRAQSRFVESVLIGLPIPSWTTQSEYPPELKCSTGSIPVEPRRTRLRFGVAPFQVQCQTS
jgi:hypothetical protein